MPQLDLDHEEAAALGHALRSYLSDLRTEITATDDADMREYLRREEAVLMGILQRISGSAT